MQDIITQTLGLLTRSPGDLVYHVIVLFAIEAMLGLVMARARRTGWNTLLRHLALGSAALLLVRGALIIVALLAQQGLPPDVVVNVAVTPPLERAIDLIGLGFLIWLTIPALHTRSQIGLGVLIVNTLAASVVYAIFAGAWYTQAHSAPVPYPATSQETVWQVWSLALAALGALAVLFSRGEQRVLACLALITVAAGHALQWLMPPALDAPAWVRLTQLAAYPLLAIVIYQLTTPEEAAPRPAPIDLPAPARSDVSQAVWQTLGAIQNVVTSDDLSLALQQVAVPLSNAVQADLTAIGLLSEIDRAVELTAVHHPGAAPAPGASFPLERQPNVKRALDRRRPIAISVGDAAPELAELFGLMGSFVTGPLLIVPLQDGSRALGVALFGNPTSRRDWTASDVDKAQTLCNHLGVVLGGAQERQTLTTHLNSLNATFRATELEAATKRRSLETALAAAQGEAQRAGLQLAALVKLQDALTQQRGSDEARVQELAEERAKLEMIAAERQNEIDRLLKLQSGLEYQLKDAQQLMTRLQEQTGAAQTDRAGSSAVSGAEREVVASIVQELRTPMTSITGYTDLLLGESVGILGAMQRQFLQRVKANIERMDGMLNDLIGVTALDAGQLKIEPEAVDVPEVIQDSVLSAGALLSEQEQSVRVELSDNLPKLSADRDSLQQIMKHLLTNAALCSPAHSEIVVRAQMPPDMPDFVLFSVVDQGGGIAPEDRQRAFNRMYRADHPLVQGLGETGIGLSLSKTLVEAQGGRIWVDSEMGTGSTFTFILPIHAQRNGTSA